MDDLITLLGLPGPSGDEGPVADWLIDCLPTVVPDAQVTRIGDNLLVLRGTPRVALFAHLDSTGFTLGYDEKLIAIGGPDPSDGDMVRSRTASGDLITGKICLEPKQRIVRLKVKRSVTVEPGTRWLYARDPEIAEGYITAPYLDNRAGVWCALRAVHRSRDVAVAFTTGEEQSGHGARVCADWLYRQHGLTQALVVDVTWHTKHTPCGNGTVISLRDAFCPRQAYLDRVLGLATASGIRFQREIQASGSSDGGHLLRSPIPMDWVFIGPPEHDPHTSRERLALIDLDHTTDLLVHLAARL